MAISATQSTSSPGVPQAQQPRLPDAYAAQKSGGSQDVAATLPAPKPLSAEQKAKEAAEHEAQVRASAQELNDFMKRFSIGLNFSVDADTKQVVVKVMNKATGEMIRQIPSEESLKLAKAAHDLQGLIIRAKA